MDYRFAQPDFLWAFVPLALFVTYLLWRRTYREIWFSWRRFWLASLGFSFCIFALARPQGGSIQGEPEPLTPHILVAMDISNSMLAEDVTPSRLGFSVSFIQRILESLVKPRMALFPFASSGFLQMPFTTDVFAINESLQSLDPTATSHQGTDFNESLLGLNQLLQQLETKALEQLEGWQNPKVILFSDGETHVPLRDETLKPFQQRKIPIFTVGVGTTEGTSLSLDSSSHKPVVTKLNVEPLKAIAIKTGGAYFSSNYENIPVLLNQLSQTMALGKRSRHFKVQTELFPVCFLLSLVFFFWEFCFGRWQYVIRSLVWISFLGLGFVASAEEDQLKAIQAYNKGLEQLALKNLEKAAELFEESSLVLQKPEEKKKALFNLGNTFLKMGDPEQALESYQKAFLTKSSDDSFEIEANKNISDNMALAAKVLDEMKKQGKPQGAGENGKDNKEGGKDPKGPQQFEGDSLSEQQKQKLYDLISSEEKQTLKRLREQNRPPQPSGTQPW